MNFPGERLVDDRNFGRGWTIGPGELAPCEERDAECAEIACADPIVVRGVVDIGTTREAIDIKTAPRPVPSRKQRDNR